MSASADPEPRRFRLIGPGRAGGSVAGALTARGWRLVETLVRGDDLTYAAAGVDAVVIAVPDDAIAAVAATITPDQAVLVHLSGAKPLDVLAPHQHRASFHPLLSLPSPEVGRARLLAGAAVAVAGDPVAAEMANSLGATVLHVAEKDRVRYHAAATIAANHLVVLCEQVARLADSIGVPVEAYWELMASTLDNVAGSSPQAALTGPAARGDTETLAAHLRALPESERPLYQLMADRARLLASDPPPSSPAT